MTTVLIVLTLISIPISIYQKTVSEFKRRFQHGEVNQNRQAGDEDASASLLGLGVAVDVPRPKRPHTRNDLTFWL